MRIVLVNTGHPGRHQGRRGGGRARSGASPRRAGPFGRARGPPRRKAVERSEDRGVRVHALPNRNLYYAFDGAKRPAPLRLAWHAIDSANPGWRPLSAEFLDQESRIS
jgi:hypothetical protein